MSFLVYDITFLVLFFLFVIIFLYKKRKNLKREGIMFLYRTKLGIKFINYIGGKYKKTLKVLQYFAITCGYFLMAGIFFLFFRVIYLYIKYPQITKTVSAPPIMPLIPYFTRIFNLQSIFPDFYFTYFIIVILVLATVHEFAHGIFARFHKVKIKSTGFGFLGPLLAAFVEPDEKQMQKKPKLAQMSILSAGTFANIITSVFFLIVMYLLFISCFQPSGVMFQDYSYTILNKTNDVILTQDKIMVNNVSLTKINYDGRDYLVNKEVYDNSEEMFLAYHDLGAINSELKGDISEIDGNKIESFNMVVEKINGKKIGDKIIIKTDFNEKIKEYEITLEENYFREGEPAIGIVFNNPESEGFFAKMMNLIFFYKKDGVSYKANNFILFISDLLFWLILINFFAALFNMLPVGIFDGGRFFFLTLLGITGKEKTAKKYLKAMAYFVLLIFIAMMLFWIFTFF